MGQAIELEATVVLTIFASFAMLVSYYIGKDSKMSIAKSIDHLRTLLADTPSTGSGVDDYEAGYVAGIADAIRGLQALDRIENGPPVVEDDGAY